MCGLQEDADDIRGTTQKDEIFDRDYSAPTGEDAWLNKELLPKVMQVSVGLEKNCMPCGGYAVANTVACRSVHGALLLLTNAASDTSPKH
jgi:hypothetical protein